VLAAPKAPALVTRPSRARRELEFDAGRRPLSAGPQGGQRPPGVRTGATARRCLRSALLFSYLFEITLVGAAGGHHQKREMTPARGHFYEPDEDR